jgi:hypothetical protein
MMQGMFILQIAAPSTRGGKPFDAIPFEMVMIHFFKVFTSLDVSGLVIWEQANAEESHLFYSVPPTAKVPLSLYSAEQNRTLLDW